MIYRICTRSILLGLIVLLVSVVVVGERIDQIAENQTNTETNIAPRHGDSGCVEVYCGMDCVENFGNWECWTKARFERYDEQMRPLPIKVTAKGDCWVSTFYGNYFWSCTSSKIGSGRVTASTECWKFAALATDAGNEGRCLCQEQ